MRKNSFLFILSVFSLFMHAQFFNTEMAYFGLSDIANPAYNIKSVNEAECSAMDFLSMPELAMPYFGIHMAMNEHHFKAKFLGNRNAVMGRYTLCASYIYSAEGFSAGIMPYAMLTEIEGTFNIMKGLRYGFTMRKEMAIAGFSGGISDRYNDAMFFAGAGTEMYSVYAVVNNQIFTTIGMGFNLNLNDRLSAGMFMDMDRRISGTMALSLLPINVEYSAMFSDPGGLSHRVSLIYMFTPSMHMPGIETTEFKPAKTPVLKIKPDFPVDINSADVYDLMNIQGIGYRTALMIIERRIELGRFTSYAQIDSLTGIGETMLKRIRENTIIGE